MLVGKMSVQLVGTKSLICIGRLNSLHVIGLARAQTAIQQSSHADKRSRIFNRSKAVVMIPTCHICDRSGQIRQVT
jgi:hypothetical protein